MKKAKLHWRDNWDRLFGMLNTYSVENPHIWARLRDCAVAEMNSDPDCQEIGSSDVNHTIFARIQNCEEMRDIIKVAFEWSTEQALQKGREL